MPKKKKSTLREPARNKSAGSGARLPEAMAHTVRRQMELPPESIAKFREVLAQGLPVKISLDLTSTISAPLVQGPNKKIAETALGDGDIIIDTSDLQPPDPGEPIPDEAAPTESTSVQVVAARVAAPPPGWKLVGAKVEVYAVAVFQPRYANVP